MRRARYSKKGGSMIKQMENEINQLKNLFEQIDWNDDEIYATWLSQCYYMVRYSTAYLGLCMFHSVRYPDFQRRCIEHISEENGHEVLILNDLKFLGMQLREELPETASIYQTQYYKISEENPVSFLGYIFMLELLAPAFGNQVMSKVKNKKALTFLKVHTVADEGHIEEAKAQISNLSGDLQKLVYNNFKTTYVSYVSLLKALAQLRKSNLAA